MADDKNASRDQLIKLLEIQEGRVRHHHDSLWKEETHYTWISYILAGGLLSIFLLVIQNKGKIHPFIACVTFIASVILSLLGVIMCNIGYSVIQRERKRFEEQVATTKKLRSLLIANLDNKYEGIFTQEDINFSPYDKCPIPNSINPQGIKLFFNKYFTRNNTTIIDNFEFTMVMLRCFFISCIAISIVLLILSLLH